VQQPKKTEMNEHGALLAIFVLWLIILFYWVVMSSRPRTVRKVKKWSDLTPEAQAFVKRMCKQKPKSA
jgi:hypothetical protein